MGLKSAGQLEINNGFTSQKAGESVIDYFWRRLDVANKMHIHCEKMGDVTIVENILRSMITKFDYVICSIEESHDIDALSIDELQSSLHIMSRE